MLRLFKGAFPWIWYKEFFQKEIKLWNPSNFLKLFHIVMFIVHLAALIFGFYFGWIVLYPFLFLPNIWVGIVVAFCFGTIGNLLASIAQIYEKNVEDKIEDTYEIRPWFDFTTTFIFVSLLRCGAFYIFHMGRI